VRKIPARLHQKKSEHQATVSPERDHAMDGFLKLNVKKWGNGDNCGPKSGPIFFALKLSGIRDIREINNTAGPGMQACGGLG